MVATRGNGWHLAPSLVDLMEEVDARWPNRSTASDGSIGDTSHAARPSEHNPDRDNDPMPRETVSAVDITKDSAAMMEVVRKALVGDDRVWYCIHNGFIWSRTNDWAKKVYDGPNKHLKHLHVSLRQTAAAASDTSSWGIKEAPAPKPDPKPEPTPPKPAEKKLTVLSIGDKDSVLVPFLKRYYGLDDKVNGETFSRALLGKVRAYQSVQGLVVDGVVGTKTWAKIASGGTKLPEGYKL